MTPIWHHPIIRHITPTSKETVGRLPIMLGWPMHVVIALQPKGSCALIQKKTARGRWQTQKAANRGAVSPSPMSTNRGLNNRYSASVESIGHPAPLWHYHSLSSHPLTYLSEASTQDNAPSQGYTGVGHDGFGKDGLDEQVSISNVDKIGALNPPAPMWPLQFSGCITNPSDSNTIEGVMSPWAVAL